MSLETVKSYWNANPCNRFHSSKDAESLEYSLEVTRKKYFVEPHIPAFADFDLWKNKVVVELGCGIGTDTISFAKAGARVVAIDLSDESIRIAKLRAAAEGVSDSIKFINHSIEDLDTLDLPTPDLVYSFGVIHHTPNPEKVIDAVRGLMSHKSEFRIMVYSRASYKTFKLLHDIEWNLPKLDSVVAKQSERAANCPITYTYTVNSAKRLLRGLSITDIRKAHIFPWRIDAYRNGQYVLDDDWKDVPTQDRLDLEEELGWHLLIKATL